MVAQVFPVTGNTSVVYQHHTTTNIHDPQWRGSGFRRRHIGFRPHPLGFNGFRWSTVISSLSYRALDIESLSAHRCVISSTWEVEDAGGVVLYGRNGNLAAGSIRRGIATAEVFKDG